MCKAVSDFVKSSETVNGYGRFEGRETALRLALDMSKNQKRQFHRYGIVPAALFRYLKEVRAIKRETHIPKEKRTIDGLLDLLWDGGYRDGKSRSEAECLRFEILKERYPMLRKSFGGAGGIWRRGEEESIY